MSTSFELSRGQRAAWVAGLLVLLLVSAAVVFGLTNDSLREGQGSPLAKEYTTVSDGEGDGSEATFPATFGEEGKASTLVLYDKTDNTSSNGELYAVATGNLVTHFGTAEIKPVAEYADNAMNDYDAVVYIGTDSAATLPPAFLDDVLTSDTPVMWVGENLNAMTSGPRDVTRKVVPSGAARLTWVAPMVPVAPALLSTRNGWPRVWVSLGPIARATLSVEPPGGNGTTRVTGFEGQTCAWAPAAIRVPMARRPRNRFMRVLREGG